MFNARSVRGMPLKRTVILLVVALAAAGIHSSAHHRYGDTYIEGKAITIEGEVSQWVYRDPHSYLHVMTQAPRTAPERWIVECRGAGQLAHQGITRETLMPGQRVVVTGNPGRVPSEHRLLLRSLVRPKDGWKWPERAGLAS